MKKREDEEDSCLVMERSHGKDKLVGEEVVKG